MTMSESTSEPRAAAGENTGTGTSDRESEPKPETHADGLTQAEAQKRLTQYGYNELPEKHENPLLKFLSYFWGPIAWMIEAAAVLSAVVRHWEDFYIIMALLLMNAGVGF